MSWTTLLFGAGYFLFFLGCAVALVWWQRRQRNRRKPFVDELRLLRAPGESQLKIYLQFDDEFIKWVGLASGIPALIMAVMLGLTLQIPEIVRLPWLIACVIAFIASFLFAVRWFAKKTDEMSNRYLGYFGERIVAEQLEPLKQQGWQVFHDVPCINNGHKFNIDHIAVGPNGVFVIETKTRRKGGARPGFDDHKAYFDGRALVWPWGEDNHGLEQAERNSLWLADTIKAETGERVFVTPFLTLPGWWVENKPSRESRLCRVVNPKALSKFLVNGRVTLEQKQIDAIAAKLDARCRDVEY